MSFKKGKATYLFKEKKKKSLVTSKRKNQNPIKYIAKYKHLLSNWHQSLPFKLTEIKKISKKAKIQY